MDLFNSLPLKKQEYMNRLFRNCTEEVKYYMSVIDVEAGPGDFFGEIECFAGLTRYRRFWYSTRHERAFPKKWGFLLKLWTETSESWKR